MHSLKDNKLKIFGIKKIYHYMLKNKKIQAIP